MKHSDLGEYCFRDFVAKSATSLLVELGFNSHVLGRAVKKLSEIAKRSVSGCGRAEVG